MVAPQSTSTVAEVLEQFRSRVNADSRLESILRGWEPVIVVEDLGTGWTRFLLVRGCRIAEIRPDCDDAAHVVHLRASPEVLTAVFDGRLNPTDAFLNGDLQVFATDRDQVKLDAISLVLWGA